MFKHLKLFILFFSHRWKKCCVLLTFVLGQIISFAQAPLTLSVYVNKPGAEVTPTMWGIFFEDINFAADGGLYAELVKNRSFEFYEPLMGWKEIKEDGGEGRVLIINRDEAEESNPRFARVTATGGDGKFGISNEGFRGMGVWKDKRYDFSFFARQAEGHNKVHIELISSVGQKIGEASIGGFNNQWRQYGISFTSDTTDMRSSLRILFEDAGTLDVDMISLFPHNTWKTRPNGLRADLVKMLADLKPGFIRFPGGCIVEGHELKTRYQWKKTVGYPEERKLIINRWNTEFRNHQTPDYFQSFGLGFFEYFLLAEDLGAEPLPILNCGMACQYNTAEVVPLDQLDPYIQDALDLIEFANGSVNSTWGKVRSAMGHPQPFNLKLLGVGNEQWDEQYIERYKEFAAVIKKKYPDIQLISSAGPSSEGPRFDYLWRELKKLDADLIDEHYYKDPSWFLNNATRYDNYDRNGPKVFAGEYAAHSKEDKEPESRNNWASALAEAAFMTGLERNADVVSMASYAPLFAHVEAWQWRPDLIWFDNLRVMGTPNYYVQKLFSTSRGTHVVPVLHDGNILAGKEALYASATINKESDEVILKIVNVSSAGCQIDIDLRGAAVIKKKMTIQELWSPSLTTFNSLENPYKISPVTKEVSAGKNQRVTLSPSSLTVITLHYREPAE